MVEAQCSLVSNAEHGAAMDYLVTALVQEGMHVAYQIIASKTQSASICTFSHIINQAHMGS